MNRTRSRVTSTIEKAELNFSIAFRPMRKDLAEIVADRLTESTGEPCRTKLGFQHRFTLERFNGSRWVAA